MWTIIGLLLAAALGIGIALEIADVFWFKREELDTIPLEEMREALDISEHAQTAIVNGKPVHFDSNGKEIP